MILNADTGGMLADLPIGSAVDGVAYDPGLQRIYTANGLGTLTVIQPTHLGGHSVIGNPITHRIAYFGSITVYEPILR